MTFTVTKPLSLLLVLRKTKKDFLRYIGYLNFTKDHISHVLYIANSSSFQCTATELSKLLTPCLTAIKNHLIKYCEKVYERSGINLFWSINNSGEVLNKLKSRGYHATSLSAYDFLYTTLPHNLIKEKVIYLTERIQREWSLYLGCNDRNAFFTSEEHKRYTLWSCQSCMKPSPFFGQYLY